MITRTIDVFNYFFFLFPDTIYIAMNLDPSTSEGKVNVLFGAFVLYLLWHLLKWCDKEGMTSAVMQKINSGPSMRLVAERSDSAGDVYGNKYLSGSGESFLGRGEPLVFANPPGLVGSQSEGMRVSQSKLEAAMRGA